MLCPLPHLQRAMLGSHRHSPTTTRSGPLLHEAGGFHAFQQMQNFASRRKVHPKVPTLHGCCQPGTRTGGHVSSGASSGPVSSAFIWKATGPPKLREPILWSQIVGAEQAGGRASPGPAPTDWAQELHTRKAPFSPWNTCWPLHLPSSIGPEPRTGKGVESPPVAAPSIGPQVTLSPRQRERPCSWEVRTLAEKGMRQGGEGRPHSSRIREALPVLGESQGQAGRVETSNAHRLCSHLAHPSGLTAPSRPGPLPPWPFSRPP